MTWPLGAAILALLPSPARAEARMPTLAVVAFSAEAGNSRVELPGPGLGRVSGEAMLGTAYRVRWFREGSEWRIRATRTDRTKVWRLALEARYPSATTALTPWHFTLPVRVPLAPIARRGQAYWVWTIGVPSRLVSEAPDGRAALTPITSSHHGFWILGEADGTTSAQFGLDAWEVNASTEMAFRLGPAAAAQPAVTPPPGPSTLKGFLRVDRQGWAFTDAAGKPIRMMGRNQHDFVSLTRKEQVALLRGMRANGMNTLRILVQDPLFRPLPGVWNGEAIRRLRQALDLCASFGIRVVICLELSGCGYQYSISQHASPCWSDLYVLPEARVWYADMVDKVVRPLRTHPAVAAWDVTNEPDMPPDPASRVQAEAFRAWRAANRPSGGPTPLPSVAEYEAQNTEAGRDYWAWSSSALADAVIARARMVRRADPNHLITLSAWDPRLLRGHKGAEAFDYWSPHTYDLWLNGPVIEKHLLGLVLGQRNALPDRPRPVVIEEFGMSEAPGRPEALRAEHVRQFLAAAAKFRAGGILHWWDMAPALLEPYRTAPAMAPPLAGKPLAIWLPPSRYASTVIYSRYMDRRKWEEALWKAVEAGYSPRFIAAPSEASGMAALLQLDEPAPGDEAAFAAGTGLPAWAPTPR